MTPLTRNLIRCFLLASACIPRRRHRQPSWLLAQFLVWFLSWVFIWGSVVLLQSPSLLAFQTGSPQYSFAPGKKITLNDNSFAPGSIVLEPIARDQLSFVARQMKSLPSLKIEVSGYTDNEGDAAQNLQLSYKRAEAVRAYLIKLEVPPERVIARGYGDMQPLVANKENKINDPQSRNRRVDIVGLSGATERALTSPRGTPLEPEARLTLVQNRVLTLAPWELDWTNAVLQQPIYELHKIQTGDASRAIVTFKDQGTLQVAENSVVVLYRSQERFTNQISAGEQTGNIGLIKGRLWLKLKSLKATDPVVVRTPTSEITMQQSAVISSDDQGRSLISVHEGTVDVATLLGNIASGVASGVASGSMLVRENFGTRVSAGKPPEQPRPLPTAPVLNSPSDSLVESSTTVQFSWDAGTSKTRLEVVEAGSQRVVFSNITNTESLNLPLSPGSYTFFVSAIDSIGLESKRIAHPLAVIAIRTPPFRLFEYVAMVGAAVLGWYGFLFRTRWAKWTGLGLALMAMGLLVLR